jgi:hypothetical protein
MICVEIAIVNRAKQRDYGHFKLRAEKQILLSSGK